MKGHLAVLTMIVVVIAAGCATRMADTLQAPVQTGKETSGAEKQRIASLLAEIEGRNRTIEDNADWIRESYRKFRIRNLASIKEESYEKYGQYLYQGGVYIIVHPAYYAFFHERGRSDKALSKSAPPLRNALDSFLNEAEYSDKVRLVKAQEKYLRDFLEYASTEKRLIILVLPGKYSSYEGYQFKGGNDEYLRYLNEVTNESDSVIYMYSKKPNRGTLAEKDRKRLISFLYRIKAASVLVGGGYVGRCVEDFLKDMEQYYSEEKLYLVPELISISPSDISSSLASDMLLSDGEVDISLLSRSLEMNALGNQEISPKLKRLSLSAAEQ
ncbi:MAG: hypothetical protein HZA15_16355 [Nitrospirae bacterium]|nr:hypothetical protein [Nitrospirota bacterium]